MPLTTRFQTRVREVLTNYRRNAGRFPAEALRRIDAILAKCAKTTPILPERCMAYEATNDAEVRLILIQEMAG